LASKISSNTCSVVSATEPSDARVHVEDVNPSVLLAHLLEQGVEFGGLRDIGGDRNTVRAEFFLSVADGLRAAPGYDYLRASLMNCLAAARPIPLVPPVMRTILFVNRLIAFLPLSGR
jgi:hypothetical protein